MEDSERKYKENLEKSDRASIWFLVGACVAIVILGIAGR